jgi:hypothetical protein
MLGTGGFAGFCGINGQTWVGGCSGRQHYHSLLLACAAENRVLRRHRNALGVSVENAKL